MRGQLFKLRFRTRLALVMFVTIGLTSALLTWTHFQHRRQIMVYVAAEASRLVSIIRLAETKIPPTADLNQAAQVYQKAMEDAGFHVSVVNLSGEVISSTIPGQIGTKVRIKKRRPQAKPGLIEIKATLPEIDTDPSAEQKTYSIQFPIIQNEKVIGYADVQGKADEVEDLLRRWYKERLYSLLATMMAALSAVVYLAFRFTKPIDLLAEGARQVAQGNLNVSLAVDGRNEMASLAETFNRMVERLRENRDLQARLYEAEKSSLRGRFAATVAHEVRNSLNFMNLSIDQIRAKRLGGDERSARDLYRNLANMKDEVSRLNRLVNDFMAAGRQAPPKLAPCDLSATASQAIALVEKQALRLGIQITARIPPDLPTLQADVSQMKTCFLNILTNAIEAMPHGGHIRIHAECLPVNGNSAVVQLRFADTGPGIPPQDHEKVFTPYFSTKDTGFGLGLAITRKIIEDHGGRIYVTNGTVAGTVMVVELPLPSPSDPRPAVPTAAGSA